MSVSLPGCRERWFRWHSALLLGFILLASRLLYAAADDSSNKIILVGIYQNEPKVFLNEAGQPSGIFVDLLEEVARNEGWQIRYVSGSWADGLDRLVKGEIDLMVDVAFSAERDKIYSFHQESVISSWDQIYARQGSDIKSLLNLQGKRVSVLERSVQQTAFEQLASSFDLKVTILPMTDYTHVFAAVETGEADAAIANNFFGATHFRKYGLADTAVIFHPAALFFATPKNSRQDLLDTLDRHLRRLKADPQSAYYRSVKRWLSEDVTFQFPAWIRTMVLTTGAVLALSLTGSFVLNRQVQIRTRELKEANDQLHVMDRTLRATATQLDSQIIMDHAVRGVLDLTGLEGGILCLMQPDTGLLHLHVAIGASEAMVASLREKLLHPGESLVDQTSQRQEPLIIEDQASEHPVATQNSVRQAGIRLFAGFPLRAHRGTIGVLCVFSRSEARIDPRKVVLIKDICGPLALALENATLYNQVKHNAEELERRVAERTDALQAAMEQARSADHIKSAFLATMSHELRTPLNSIIGFTGILLQGLPGPLNEEQRKQMTMVQSSSKHLLALINDVLDISKIEAGQLRLACATFDPRVSIEKMVRLVSPLAEKKNLILHLEAARDLPHLTTDQGRFEQILLNLINNAIKYSDHGNIVVRCLTENDQQLLVSVTDTGIGIKPEFLPKLFHPFYQVDMGISRKYEGTGLGLSICRRLLDLMGGTIAVESEPGRGSIFSVRLPLHPGDVT
ncbi:MAG: ATP-binding protein [Candidatus Ozemobacteraceae bacterium]